jgi:hypothetical protein
MRWIEVDLWPHRHHPAARQLLDQAFTATRELRRWQEREGLDSPVLVRQMASVGQFLFRAVTSVDPQAFSPARPETARAAPISGVAGTDPSLGYHLRVPPAWLALPWTWLHNGVGFLVERCPLAAASFPSEPPVAAPARGWMRRWRETLLAEGLLGHRPLGRLLDSIRPQECGEPEILFVPGHCEARIRHLIHREADSIQTALAGSATGRPLARLLVPEAALTPAFLLRRAHLYQGLHFAGPTACAQQANTGDEREAWLSALLGRAGASEDENPGNDLEVVGVDPITALLDIVSQRAAQTEQRIQDEEDRAADERGAISDSSPALAGAGSLSGRAGPHEAARGRWDRTGAAGGAVGGRPPWLLEDGPVQPESLGQAAGLPPLVFSNSHCSLPQLGVRFLTAGASTFVGCHLPLYSRPARELAAHFYGFLADGLGAAAALRAAGMACREQFGPDHPVWLSYGLIGYGSLALAYL